MGGWVGGVGGLTPGTGPRGESFVPSGPIHVSDYNPTCVLNSLA